MARYLSNRDGGKTDEAGHLRFLNSMTVGDVFKGGTVTQNGTPNMSVIVSEIDAIIRDTGNGYAYHVWSDGNETVTIATANAANPRKDYVIAYVDRGVAPSTADPNNPAIWKFIAVAGTPAGSPTVPSVAQIQASPVGMNPYIILATINVATSTATITNGSIVDSRTLVRTGLIPMKVDANGWTVYDYGTHKVYKKFVSGTVTIAANGGTTIGSQGSPAGVTLSSATSFVEVSFNIGRREAHFTNSTITGGAVFIQTRNNSSSTLTDCEWSAVMTVTTK